jgi:atypical dual specificity phosphatase
MNKVFAYAAFYPTLLWDIAVWQYLYGANKWDKIEPNLFLGAYPTTADATTLHQLGVRAIVNCCHEIVGPTEDYERLGMVQLRLPTTDFSEPQIEKINTAIDFIKRFLDQGKGVYVHCKSGRGRSPTVVLCWLIYRYGLTPEDAKNRLIDLRPQVRRGIDQGVAVRQFLNLRSSQTS